MKHSVSTSNRMRSQHGLVLIRATDRRERQILRGAILAMNGGGVKERGAGCSHAGNNYAFSSDRGVFLEGTGKRSWVNFDRETRSGRIFTYRALRRWGFLSICCSFKSDLRCSHTMHTFTNSNQFPEKNATAKQVRGTTC